MILFENFKEIESICQKYKIKNYNINQDGTIDVNDNVSFYSLKLEKLPLNFRNVTGWFICTNNRLRSLDGSPKLVESYFYCENNELTTLNGSPNRIGLGDKEYGPDFLCYNNNLTTLNGSPQIINGNINISENNITSLKGLGYVGGCIYYHNNPIEKILDNISNLQEKLNSVIEVFNEYDVKLNTDKEYLEQLFADYGIIYKI